MLRDLIVDFLRQQPGLDEQRLADPQARMKELGLDSLGLVEMLFEVEDRYGFQIEEPTRFADMTLDEVVADLEAAVRARHREAVIEPPSDPAPDASV